MEKSPWEKQERKIPIKEIHFLKEEFPPKTIIARVKRNEQTILTILKKNNVGLDCFSITGCTLASEQRMRINGGIRGKWCSRCYQTDEKDNEDGTKDLFAQAQFILASRFNSCERFICFQSFICIARDFTSKSCQKLSWKSKYTIKVHLSSNRKETCSNLKQSRSEWFPVKIINDNCKSISFSSKWFMLFVR